MGLVMFVTFFVGTSSDDVPIHLYFNLTLVLLFYLVIHKASSSMNRSHV